MLWGPIGVPVTVVFGTLGFTPQKLLPTVAAHADVEKLVFYHDRHAKSRTAAERVRAFCRERKLDVEGVELDAFDVIDSALRMRRDLKRAGAERAIFNVTGGTPVISAAATLACILEGVRAVYVDERDGREVPLPLLSLRYDEVLNAEQRAVLREVDRRGARGATQSGLARTLKLSRSTVNHHVKNLKAKQLLLAERDPEDARQEILRPLPSAALLLAGRDD